MEDTSLKDSLKAINTRLDELVADGNIKKSDIPWYKRLTRGQARKNWVEVCYIQENKVVSFMKAPIDEGVILLNGIPHTISSDEILIYRNKPFIIVPSWSIKPFSAAQNIKDTKETGNSSMGWEYLFNYMKKTEIKQIKNMSIMLWLIAGIIVIGAGYYFIKNGGFW